MESIDQKKCQEIINILHELGIPSHLNGYRYLKELLYENSICCFNRKNIYLCLIKKYKLSKNVIERSIRYAIDVGWNRGNFIFIEELFGYSINVDKNKPTNHEFILTVIEKII